MPKKSLKWIIFGVLTAVLLLVGWVFAQRPQKVEMAAYVPAETLVYLEANDLPKILQSLTETNAWRELAPVYKIESDFGRLGWLNQILAAANLGSTETIVAGRAQVAVVLLGLTAADAETALKIRPNYAVVIETKSARAEDFVDRQVGRFAGQQFGEIRIEKSERENATWTIFRSTQNEKQLFAAVQGSIAVIGNEEETVQACLDAKNGKRKSLLDNEALEQARLSADAEHAFAFGFVAPAGVRELSQIGAIFAAGQIAENPGAIGLLSQALPPFAQKTVKSIAWTARSGANGKIEDRFLIEMPKELVARLRDPLAASDSANDVLAEMIPAQIDSVTFYNFKNPQTAWRGFVMATIAQLDTVSAAVFSQAAGSLLEPYGVRDVNSFLGGVSGQLAVARLSDQGEKTIVYAAVRDLNAVRKSLQLGAEGKESILANDILQLGSADGLETGKAAREQHSVLKTQDYWQDFVRVENTLNPPFVQTLAQDRETAVQFVKTLAREKNRSIVAPSGEKLPLWAWTKSETRLVREGFERRTLSAFGLVGTLVARISDEPEK